MVRQVRPGPRAMISHDLRPEPQPTIDPSPEPQSGIDLSCGRSARAQHLFTDQPAALLRSSLQSLSPD